ncbi:MAG: hypothetical protein M0P91_05320 [Sulfuricurvum sp.]|jgi:hypothetical protein|uniref:hypothetical protein n=1 Tax=Sulfuricurvum sp. TaxID=2025608 RepID=UPI0025F7FF4E|nr:hypothetical protein [Sulfuricurvum sp.]MCK9372596.1 hypothetical protein [Sulfuricurvum sp.]
MGKIIGGEHYERFVQKAKRNPKMLRIPTHKELENNGFDIPDLFHLVLPNGLTVNPETVNPDTDLFDDAIKPLFLKQSKVCEACGMDKPTEAYGKRLGRGGLRSICMACEETAKTDITYSLPYDLSKDQIQIVDGRNGGIKRYVSYEDVITLVNEAFFRGKSEGMAKVSPSLDELLGHQHENL